MGSKALSTPIIYNVSITLANTEYSQVLPKGTKKVLIQLRDAANMILYYVTGASTYITIPAGASKSLEGVWLEGTTLFFKSTSASQTAEVEVWQ